MAANIGFLSSDGVSIHDLAGSGIGFFGSDGFGASVRVGEYQDHTFICSSNGTTEGPEISNIKYLNSGSGIIGQTGSGIALTAIPNRHATLNVRFTYDSAVQVTSAYARIYDRTSINSAASGVTTKMAELIHPDPANSNNGSGDTTWYTPAGSSVIVPLANSPGISGLWAGDGSNSTRTDTRHDFFLAISASPDSIGSKTLYSLWVELEYL